jgi:hypothetical protein
VNVDDQSGGATGGVGVTVGVGVAVTVAVASGVVVTVGVALSVAVGVSVGVGVGRIGADVLHAGSAQLLHAVAFRPMLTYTAGLAASH